MPRPPKPTRAEILLHQEVDRLKTVAVLMRGELTDKAGAVTRLEILLRERLQRIDELNGKIDQLRDQNKRLDTEAERLAEMVRLSPPPRSLQLTHDQRGNNDQGRDQDHYPGQAD